MSASGDPFLRDLPAAEAIARWREACRDGGCPERVPAVRLDLADAVGRVTAAPVWATTSSPPFDAAGMDGIAVRSQRTAGASETAPVTLDPEDFAAVDTGDPLPEGFDAVVMREHVHQREGVPELLAGVVPFEHVRSVGEDIAATELLLPTSHRLRPIDVAAAAAAGAADVLAYRTPIVAVIPTGDELKPIGSATSGGEILDTNSLMLTGLAEASGCVARRWPIQPDDPDTIARAVSGACAEADLVLISAGSSAGRDDHTAAILARLGTVAVHGVAVKPGHPVVLACVDGTPVIGVPGYPVSAALTFEIFAAPYLAELEGAAPPARTRVRARLTRKLASTLGMDEWIRVGLGRIEGTLVATPLPRGAGVLTSLVRADGLLVVPAALEGHQAGDGVEVELLRDPSEIDNAIVAIGSHDLVLDLMASALRSRDPRMRLTSSNVGSLGGLLAVRDRICHIAGSHLLDPRTGEYTTPYLDEIFGADRGDVAIVRLAHREQGLIVPPGNPLGLSGIPDLARPGLRYVNRQRGAGTRMLLDHELARRDIPADMVAGYAREEHTHLAVAAAVAAGSADCGLGILAAARAFGLGFVPVAREPFDLVMRTSARAAGAITAPLFDLLADPAFLAEVEALGGYDTSESGRTIFGT